MMKLRSIELALPGAADAARFMVDVWGCADAGHQGETWYLRGSGTDPYLVAITENADSFVRSTTFVCSPERLADVARAVAAKGLNARPVVSNDPGGGTGIVVELSEGELLRFLIGATEVAPIAGHAKATRRVMPLKLTHVGQRAWCSCGATPRIIRPPLPAPVLPVSTTSRSRWTTSMR